MKSVRVVLILASLLIAAPCAASASETTRPEPRQKIFLPGADGKRVIVTGTSEELWQTAEKLTETGDYERAKMFYQQMIENNPGDARTYLLLGRLYQFKLKKFADAIKQYKRAEHLVSDANPGARAFCRRLSAEAYRELAESSNSLIYFAQAITEYEKILGYDPDDVEVLYQLGSCRLNSHDYDRAIEMFKLAVEKKPDSEWGKMAKKGLEAAKSEARRR